MTTKLLLETLRQADGGTVECAVTAPDGTILRGAIEESFFEEFQIGPNTLLSPVKKARILHDNIAYLEAEAERQWRLGNRELIIR